MYIYTYIYIHTHIYNYIYIYIYSCIEDVWHVRYIYIYIYIVRNFASLRNQHFFPSMSNFLSHLVLKLLKCSMGFCNLRAIFRENRKSHDTREKNEFFSLSPKHPF